MTLWETAFILFLCGVNIRFKIQVSLFFLHISPSASVSDSSLSLPRIMLSVFRSVLLSYSGFVVTA